MGKTSLLWTSVDCYLDHKILNNSDMKLLLFAFFTSAIGQLKFGGSSNSGSSAAVKDDTNTKNSDTKIFTGNEALDGGLVGGALGLVGGSILSGLLNGNNNNNPCGRRR